MQSISPVFTEQESHLEVVIALDQPEYFPIVILPVRYQDGTQGMAVRFEFTDEERKTIAEGGDLLLTEMTFGSHKFTPVALQIVKREKVDG